MSELTNETKLPVKPILEENGFNKIIHPIVFLAQIFGLMPLSNTSKAGRDIKFKFVSLQFAYYILICLVAFYKFLVAMLWLVIYRMEFSKICKYK